MGGLPFEQTTQTRSINCRPIITSKNRLFDRSSCHYVQNLHKKIMQRRSSMAAHFPLRSWLKRLMRIFLILLLILIIIITSSVAFFYIRHHQALVLPTPTGPYAVGRMEYDWTDQTRNDPLAPHTDTKRELVVWAWYPAEHVAGAQSAPYLPSKWAQLIDQQHGFLIQSNDTIQTHSFDKAPLASGAARYPVLI